MTEPATAVSLMRMSLALLDRNGMTIAACHLEQAIHAALDPVSIGEAVHNHDAAAAAIILDVAGQQTKTAPENRA